MSLRSESSKPTDLNPLRMIEVFKTNITDTEKADWLVRCIQYAFPGYVANFDLQDCDHILRIQHPNGDVDAEAIIRLLAQYGFESSVLPDVIQLPVSSQRWPCLSLSNLKLAAQ